MALPAVVPLDAHAERRWRQVKQWQALLEPGSARSTSAVGVRPDRVALAHMRSLQALDGVLAGASQREIALVVFGSSRVHRSWYADGELRAQTRYLIRRGREFMTGGYTRLVTGTARRGTDRAALSDGGGR